jgi:hypothetical protein
MKCDNLFTGALLIILALLLASCHKDVDSPYRNPEVKKWECNELNLSVL